MSEHGMRSTCYLCGSTRPQYPESMDIQCSVLDGCSAFDGRFQTLEDNNDDQLNDQDVQRLDMQVLHLKSALRRLEYDRSILVAFQRRRISMRSPINRLPSELLGEIFVFCLAACQSGKSMPFVLSRICNWWRTVARSTPKLWSTIDLHSAKRYPLVDVMLPLSGSVPLELSFSYRGYWTDVRPEKAERTLLTLCATSFRWKYVELDIPSLLLETMVANIEDLPLLTSLDIHTDIEPGRSYSMFQDAQQLSHMSLSGSGFSLISFILPWRRIVELDISGMDYGEVLGLISHCKSLQRVALHSLYMRPPSAALVQHIEHPNIRSLEIDDCVYLWAQPLSLPGIKDLDVHRCGRSDQHDLLSLFLEHSQCELSSLCLSVSDETSLVDMLRNMPSLVSLHIYDITLRKGARSLVHALTMPSSGGTGHTILPRLENLTVDPTVQSKVDTDSFDKMVESRLPSAGGSLRNLKCGILQILCPYLYTKSDDWRARGLETIS